MADQRSRGGKKEDTSAPQGQPEKQQPITFPESQAGDLPEPGGRPPAAEPVGPGANAGQARPQK